MILSQSLFHFYDFQLFYHSFIYVNVFSSCSDTLSHLTVSKKLYFQEKKCYISTDLLILKDSLTPNDFSILKFICRKKNLQKILLLDQNYGGYVFIFFASFFKDRLVYGMIKQRNFLHILNLSFDAKLVKYYQFRSHYHKQCPINNNKVNVRKLAKMCLIFSEYVFYRQSLTN